MTVVLGNIIMMYGVTSGVMSENCPALPLSFWQGRSQKGTESRLSSGIVLLLTIHEDHYLPEQVACCKNHQLIFTALER
jgi:hypothetical protein